MIAKKDELYNAQKQQIKEENDRSEEIRLQLQNQLKQGSVFDVDWQNRNFICILKPANFIREYHLERVTKVKKYEQLVNENTR